MARDFDDMAGPDEETGGLRAALRFVGWGAIAASALSVAVLASRTDVGGQRLADLMSLSPTATAAADRSAAPKPNPLAARLADAEAESHRLGEVVRRLVADRERVLARLETIERNIDVTASVRETAPASAPTPVPTSAPTTPPAANQTPPPPSPPVASAPPSPPATVPATPSPTASLPVVPSSPPPAVVPPVFSPPTIPPVAINSPVATPPSRPPVSAAPPAATPPAATTPPAAEQTNPGAIPNPAAESIATRTEFAIDVGGDRTVDALRALWTALRNGRHGNLFEGLRPLVAIRENGRPTGVELRLVIGPLANAGAAARLCGSLAAAGLACQPTVFDGQRLAAR
jgi:hypothetical protein